MLLECCDAGSDFTEQLEDGWLQLLAGGGWLATGVTAAAGAAAGAAANGVG